MRAIFTKQTVLVLISFLFGGLAVFGQKQSPLDIALRHVEQHKEKWDLGPIDIADMAVSDQYRSKHNGVTHIYFNQRFDGIGIFNAIMGVHITNDGKVGYVANRFHSNIIEKINTTAPAIQASQAVLNAAAHFKLNTDAPLRLLNQTGDREFVYAHGDFSNSDIKVTLAFQPDYESGALRLAWDLALDMPNSADFWSVRVDALTGEVLHQHNWTVYCNFHQDDSHQHHTHCYDEVAETRSFLPVKEVLFQQNSLLNNDGATYNVFPIPVESPIHGDREILESPADPVASPFGWHDINGIAGPEYVITRGNNVWAYLDDSDTNSSSGDEPNGGFDLTFDFNFDDQNLEPSQYQEAAVTQLFYMNNIMHDFAYHYGFNEEAGNFQENTYDNEGAGGDPVRAEAQDGADNNNANFSTPDDGFSGRMQMYLWNQAGGRIVTINEPETLAGQMFEARPGTFGGPITNQPLTGEVIFVNDGSSDPTFGCNPLINPEEIEGKIALIDRGGCQFGTKAFNAEQAGAIAVIVCNFEDALVNMGAGNDGAGVEIPAVFMSSTSCLAFRDFAGEGLVATLQLPESDGGPLLLDGDFDNGVVAHEYAHGISNRLTGGPTESSCLNNREQMGEGWSDFFSLVMTVQPGEDGTEARGIGNYVLREGVEGRGIRRQPYSTNMSINDQTFFDIIGQRQHARGEIWASVLWDLYWAMSEAYGWDPDLYNGTGGNNMAIQLVMDGMALQECDPGFIEARDGVLAADLMNYDGANQCLIWEVFARRGLGWDADQGSNIEENDGLEGYELRPECVKELKVAKFATELIEAGDEINISITVTNHKEEAVTNVVLSDEIPWGVTFVPGSATGNATITAGTDMITFEIGEIPAGAVRTYTYTLESDPTLGSIRQFYDDMENGDGNWVLEAPAGTSIWDITEGEAVSGTQAWFVPDSEEENDQIIRMLEPIEVIGVQPTLRFYHKIDTRYGWDGGILQVSTDGGTNWQSVDDQMFKNGPLRPISFFTFGRPNLFAWSGFEDEFQDTYVDLSAFAGQEILIRFRFGTDPQNGLANQGDGWYVDDVEFMDMYNYNGEACVTSEEGDQACAVAPFRGTVVQSGEFTATNEPEKLNRISVYPNPARDLLNVAIQAEQGGEVQIAVLSADGKMLQQLQTDIHSDYNLIPVNVAALQSGFYFVRISTGDEVTTKKIVID